MLAAGDIAYVNDRPVSRGAFAELLMRGRGAALLEQFVVLEAAEALAATKGIAVSAAAVDREYDRALRRLADPLSAISASSFDRAAAERVLDAVLAERGVSREEFMLGMRRNAVLRAIVLREVEVTPEQLEAEFARRYGRRVRIRHIQTATLTDAARVEERLATGEDFAELARKLSANPSGPRQGGLLAPFARDDEDVPAILRETAFALEPGRASGPLRVGNWFHIIQVESHLPAEDVSMESVGDALAQRVRDRLSEPEMEKLYEQLFREAAVRIDDPLLRAAFEARYPDRRSG